MMQRDDATALSRRGLFGGLAALVAVAVAQKSLAALSETEIDRFYQQAATGYVESVTLRISEPLKLTLDKPLRIGRMTLIRTPDFVGDSYLSFQTSGQPIYIEHLVCEWDSRATRPKDLLARSALTQFPSGLPSRQVPSILRASPRS